MMSNGCKFSGFGQGFPPPTTARAVRSAIFVLLAIFASSAASFAISDHKSDHKASDGEMECGVNNFGKVTDYYYRGAQPKEDEYAELAALGIRTIIDLRDDPKSYAREMAVRAGLRYINFPLSDSRYPAADVAPRFLSLVEEKGNWPVFVHCAGGRHRTGAMTAVFRMTAQNWDVERAYDEMKDYDFYTRWGHKAMKTFVFDYYRELLVRRVHVGQTPAVSSGRARVFSEGRQ
jgi:protein tyrosine phosphatase (PTP) superfamily phosphohydrolase (DUF442 family)